GRDEGELRELNAMLDKVLDVQHPGRVKSRIQGNGATTTGTRLPMRLTAGEPKTYFGWSKDTGRKSGNAFFSESFSAPVHTVANAVGAEVYQSQVVTDGATVKLRLLAPCYIGNIELPKGSFVHAVARFSQDRLQLHVPSVRYQSSVLLLSMDAYDLDGLEGIFASGTGGQAMAKSRVGQQLEAVELGSYDASLKSQAATASLQTAKALLFKKNKPVQITLRAGYQILLKDKAQQ
ncbi:MAG TPA: conjugative transposon protein TraM, partial [Flavisolibacter sp.]|nr:conjugative transposon protein TraM [Flavisolibacter sp.]